MMLFLLSTVIEPVLVLAGHGDSITGKYRDGTTGGGDDGGIGMAPIVGVLLLALITIGLVVWLNRQEEEPGDNSRAGRTLKLTTLAPAGVLVAIIATPLIVWTASSGGKDDKSLIVERSTSLTGDPEFLVALVEKDLNTLETTRGRRAVRIECLDRDGQTVIVGKQKWPFLKERGYDYPHAHQPASAEQVQRADRCRIGGTRAALEAKVEGTLRG